MRKSLRFQSFLKGTRHQVNTPRERSFYVLYGCNYSTHPSRRTKKWAVPPKLCIFTSSLQYRPFRTKPLEANSNHRRRLFQQVAAGGENLGLARTVTVQLLLRLSNLLRGATTLQGQQLTGAAQNRQSNVQ